VQRNQRRSTKIYDFTADYDNTMKSVTIVICNYNYDRFLANAIDSALAQDYPSTTVLVVDDGSTDNSRKLIEAYGSVIATVFKDNGGQISAYNRAIKELDSDYAILLDADDILYPSAVSEVVQQFEAGDFAKVQFRIDVISSNGKRTGACIPHSDAPTDCRPLLLNGWLYPSPPGSGNAYRVSALRQIFPICETSEVRYGADFYAIYGVALLGPIASIPHSLGGYRVHHSEALDVAFSNSEDMRKMPKALSIRWNILQQTARSRLGVELPAQFHDFSYEKALFCAQISGAPLVRRWRWAALESRNYVHSIVANPFWTLKKKIGTIVLSCLCLVPYPPLANYAVRYISNPLARHSRVAR